jgi:hypothetical protein
MMDSAEGVPVADLTTTGPAIVALRPEDLVGHLAIREEM